MRLGIVGAARPVGAAIRRALRERAERAEAAEERAVRAEREREAAARVAVAEERAALAIARMVEGWRS